MQPIFDMFERITGVMRLIIGGIVLIIMVASFAMSAGLSLFMPTMVEGFGSEAERERSAERATRRADAKREQQQAEALAEDGWGYEMSSQAQSSDRRSSRRSSEDDGGWGPAAR